MPRPRKKAKRQANAAHAQEVMVLKDTTWSAIWSIVKMSAGVLLFLVLQRQEGMAGNILRDVLTVFFGKWGLIFPLFLVISGLLHWISPRARLEMKRSTGLVLCLLAFLGLMHITAPFE